MKTIEGDLVADDPPHKGCNMLYQSPEVIAHSNSARLLRSFQVQTITSEPEPDRRASKLRKFIDGNDGQVGWSLDTVCQALGLGISGEHAGRLFKRQFGIGVREYASGRRLMKAAHLLCTTNLCIKTISGNLGYRSTADFSRKFKQEFQLTPTDYRNQNCAA
ncbi:MAG: AraC family transcriptional regulator [Acidobacteria bacterium]|nr:AraC family transcriptional regulator [Acidobacteriota bacterium]